MWDQEEHSRASTEEQTFKVLTAVGTVLLFISILMISYAISPSPASAELSVKRWAGSAAAGRQRESVSPKAGHDQDEHSCQSGHECHARKLSRLRITP